MNYSVNLLYKGFKSDDSEPLWEERIILVDALSEEEAVEKAYTFVSQNECNYQNDDAVTVSWKFEKIERVYEIDSDLRDGTELFSRFLRNKEVESILTPFSD